MEARGEELLIELRRLVNDFRLAQALNVKNDLFEYIINELDNFFQDVELLNGAELARMAPYLTTVSPILPGTVLIPRLNANHPAEQLYARIKREINRVRIPAEEQPNNRALINRRDQVYRNIGQDLYRIAWARLRGQQLNENNIIDYFNVLARIDNIATNVINNPLVDNNRRVFRIGIPYYIAPFFSDRRVIDEDSLVPAYGGDEFVQPPINDFEPQRGAAAAGRAANLIEQARGNLFDDAPGNRFDQQRRRVPMGQNINVVVGNRPAPYARPQPAAPVLQPVAQAPWLYPPDPVVPQRPQPLFQFPPPPLQPIAERPAAAVNRAYDPLIQDDNNDDDLNDLLGGGNLIDMELPQQPVVAPQGGAAPIMDNLGNYQPDPQPPAPPPRPPPINPPQPPPINQNPPILPRDPPPRQLPPVPVNEPGIAERIQQLVNACGTDFRNCFFPHSKNDIFSGSGTPRFPMNIPICESHLKSIFSISIEYLPALNFDANCNRRNVKDGPFGAGYHIENKEGIVFNTRDVILPGLEYRNTIFDLYEGNPNPLFDRLSPALKNVLAYLRRPNLKGVDLCNMRDLISNQMCNSTDVEIVACLMVLFSWGFMGLCPPLTNAQIERLGNESFALLYEIKRKYINNYMLSMPRTQGGNFLPALYTWMFVLSDFKTVNHGLGTYANVTANRTGLVARRPICHKNIFLWNDFVAPFPDEYYIKFKQSGGGRAGYDNYVKPNLTDTVGGSGMNKYSVGSARVYSYVNAPRDLVARCLNVGIGNVVTVMPGGNNAPQQPEAPNENFDLPPDEDIVYVNNDFAALLNPAAQPAAAVNVPPPAAGMDIDFNEDLLVDFEGDNYRPNLQ